MSNHSEIVRIAAIHDLCGYGKCSLGTALPVLSAAGFEVIPIPTGLFSTQTAIKGWEQLDTTSFLPRYVGSLSRNNIHYDAIYSGFLSSPDQVYIIQKLYTENLNAIRILDPVMGDNGKIYKTYTDVMCQSIKELVCGSDIITPNLTEACKLLDIDYVDQPNDKQITEIINGLKDMGAQSVVLKSARIHNDTISSFVSEKDNDIVEITNKYFPYQIHGCGDLYCSSIVSAYLNGKTLQDSVSFTVKFIERCIKYTITQKGFEQRGISFEPLLYNITGLIETAQY